MSIWKSPVFYFGIVLALVVTAALAAPYVVPWNNYRSELETFGRKLTGREVTIGGDIAVKLFPWPQLQAGQVAIGNPNGFSDAAFVKAEAMRVRLSLGGLFNGSIDVQTVEVEKPEVNLQRNASGDVNWIFAPQEQVAGQGLLSRVKLDQILVSHGILSFDDLRNGHSMVLTDLDATLSAQSILGPWRSKGTAKWNDVAFDVAVVTSAKEAEQPLKFTVKLTPQDLAYPQTALEGAWDGANFKGAVRVDPQESKGEKQSAEGALKPLTMQALVEASEQRLSLLKIKITPSDKKDSGTLIEGDAVVEFGSQSMARLDLKSPRINLDTLVGSSAVRQWRDGGFLSVVNQLLSNTPVKFVADYKFNVNVLTSGGQALNDVRLTGSLQKEGLRVQEFVAELPGRSIGIFDGILFPGQAAAQLAGKFKFESADSRAFLSWLAPTWREKFQQHWTGNRGRLLVKSGSVDWTREHVALNDVNFEFDGTAGKATLSSGFGAQQNTVVKIAMEQLDIDGLAPNGWSLLRDGEGATFLSYLGQKEENAGGNTHLEFSAKRVLLNGVSAQDAKLDVSTRATGFDIRQLSIGNVGGAKLQGGGALLDTGAGPEGELKFNLQADDPRGFLRLTGF
jgi:AsmA family